LIPWWRTNEGSWTAECGGGLVRPRAGERQWFGHSGELGDSTRGTHTMANDWARHAKEWHDRKGKTLGLSPTVSIGPAKGGVHALPCVRERAGMPIAWPRRRASRWHTGICARLGTAGQICPDTSTTESSALVLTTRRARDCRAEEPVGSTALCDAGV
jgi:hypothetical protein